MLMAADCSNKDSEFYNDVFISSPNMVDVEDNVLYTVGDYLMVNAYFDRTVPEAGQNNDIDLYKTSGGALSFTFSYLIEKEITQDQWVPVDIVEANVFDGEGNSVAFGDFLLAQSVFDPALQTYRYRGGVRLTETGSYRLRFTYNQEPSAAIVLTSDSLQGNLFVTIFSNCEDTDSAGYYYFDVN